MATATPTRPNPAAARDVAVEQAIAAAAGKVRSNDLLTGAAAAAVLFLGYLAVIVTLDKLLDLPDWVRLLGLVGLVGGLGAVVYYLVVRPMQRRVNPRYIARKIEETMPDAKNVLINWVDLQDEELPGSVKAAVGAKAAAGVADADMDSATNSKKLIWLGSAAGVLVLVLAALFLVFSGPQFFSLLGRAVVPFKPTEIASATTITIDEPEGGDVTITDGQPLTIAVSIGGRLPNANGPDKPRLLVRYSQEATEEIELPLTANGSAREFRTDLGRGTILNGFWYRVAAGDGRTPEHQVKVVTRPMLSEFRAYYDYPDYLKWQKDYEDSSKLRAIRGTVVTLTAKANRTVQSATLTVGTVDGGRELIRGEVFGEKQDRVRFKLKLRESGTYRIDFKPTGPELSTATADYPIEVEVDHKPVVEITTPKEDEIQLPLNGSLEVDGTVKDDHGIAGVELRFKVVGNDLLVIQPKKFRDGKPLVREQDNTLLTVIPNYKDSVKLDALTDANGKPVKLTEKDVLEYWVAAADNCTEPSANIGESVHKTVRLLPAIKEPEKKQEQTNKEQQRKKDEQKTEAKRDEQLKNEKRPEEQNRNQDRPPQQPDAANQDKDPKAQPNDDNPNKEQKQPEGDPQTKPDTQPQDGGQGNPPPNDAEQQRKAEELQKKIEERKRQEKEQAGDARGDGDKSEGMETKPEAGTKPPEGKQGSDGAKGATEEKAGPKSEDMTKPEGQPSQGKDGGHLTDPQRSEEKAPPKEGAKGEDKPTDDQPKSAPKEGTEAGTSKDSKEGTKPDGGKPEGTKPEDKKQDGSAGSARGAEPPPQGDKPQDPMGNGNDTQQPQGGKENKVDPKDLSGSKPKGEPTRGDTKSEPKGGGSEKTEQPKDAGGAKGEAPNKPGESKDAPKGSEKEPTSKKGPPADAGQEKEAPKPDAEGKNAPAEGKGEGKKSEKPMGSGKEEDKGSAKPSDIKKPDGSSGKQEDKNPMSNGSGEKNPDKTPPQGSGNGEKKLDPKEAEQAIKDLESKDDKTKKDAQEKLDKAIGKGNREQIEQAQKDLKSDDKATQDAAKQKLENMKKDINGGQKPKELTEQEKKELLDAAKDLDSKNPQTKKDAQDKLDKAMGKENREKLEQMQKDLKSDDKATREAAEQKLEEMAKDAQKNAGGQKPKELTEQEKKELLDAAKNLDSKDPKEKKEAQEKLDKAMGKENREKLEQMQKDLKSNDKATREAAEKQLQEMAKNAQQQGKQDTTAQKQPEMTEEQKKELADAAQKLTSKDEAERKAAEQKIDDAIGKEKRQELQQDLKDLQGNDPAKAEQARKKMEKKLEEAKNAQGGNSDKHNDNKQDRLGGSGSQAPGKPLDANLENQLKAKELALDDFKKYQGDKKFLKENDWTEEEYNRFLKQEEAAVQKFREQVAEARVNPKPEASGPPTVGRNDGSTDRVVGRGKADKLDGSKGPAIAPPGFGDAIKRFNTETSKQPK